MEEEKEVKTENVEEVKEEEQKPKTELTEEEAKEAAKNVGELLKVLDKYKSPRQRMEDKIKHYEEEKAKLPEGHYKIKQYENKIYQLDRKLHPNVVWDSSKGTYRKSKEDKKSE